jgi:sugar O-acyltransferase (sialic acid O-acetyltransferase NeuD family)
MSRINAIYGTGGFAREVIPILNEQYPNDDNIFVVHKEYLTSEKSINGYPVMSYEDFIDISSKEKSITVAISDALIRSRVSTVINQDGIRQSSIISNKSVIMDEVMISNGTIICPFVTITSNIRIGQNFHANIYSYVAHDCIIGDNVTFAPSVKCNGNVIIEDNVYIGTGAIIKQGKSNNPIILGANSIISAGSFVTRNVQESTTVYGNPAKILSKSSIK